MREDKEEVEHLQQHNLQLQFLLFNVLCSLKETQHNILQKNRVVTMLRLFRAHKLDAFVAGIALTCTLHFLNLHYKKGNYPNLYLYVFTY